MPPRAVLFDFDGVLADTENVHVAAWERTFAQMNLDVPPEACARAAEEDDRPFLASIWDAEGIEGGDLDGWVARKQAIVRRMLADWPRLYPGVPELVGRLDGRARLAVVSGTWRENVSVVLEAAGLAGSFALIVGKEDVRRPKPAPDAYRLALRRLEVEPGDAVALEDSPTGLASARGAKIDAVAVGHRRGRGEWAEGAAYVEGLGDVDRALRAIGFA
jgi:HAD superfamily hydrolase (TIGR01509 family)